MNFRFIIGLLPHFVAISLATATPSWAQTVRPIVDGYSRDQVEAICRPGVPSAAAVVARIGGSRDNAHQRQYGPNDTLVIDGGTQNGFTTGQLLAVRRQFLASDPTGVDNVRIPGEDVSGWVRLTRVESDWAEASIVYQCTEFTMGDALFAFEVPVLGSESVGNPRYDDPATVLFADEGKTIAGPTELVVISRGADHGLRVGQRVTLFRRLFGATGPISPLGEATIVVTAESSATIRLDSARDAVQIGDLVAPHEAR